MDIDFSKCKNEQQFKMLYVNKILKPQYKYVFCIETEETVKGFPDVMCINALNRVEFYEFKYTKTDRIKFQATQPSFYKAHKDLSIWVVSYKEKTNEVVEFPVWDMSTVKGERKFYINNKAEVRV